jgi:hypothetical protein
MKSDFVFFSFFSLYVRIHQLPKDIDHTQERRNIVLSRAIILEENKDGSTYFSSTFDVNETSVLSHAIAYYYFFLRTHVYSEKERKIRVVIFFLLDYVWERELGNQYVRIVLINDGGQ